jgi:head-tail adaptor
MTIEIERFIRIQNAVQRTGQEPEWRTLPNCTRVRVWEMSSADALAAEAEEVVSVRRMIFHIAFVDGVIRGSRVTYLGQNFQVLGVSDSTRLRGLELRCAPSPA